MPSETSSDDAKEGTMLHALVRHMWTNPEPIADEEHSRLVSDCIDLIREFTEDADDDAVTFFETTLAMPWGGNGTPDLVICSKGEGGHGILVDWKFGRQFPGFERFWIPASEDLQLAAYAVAAMEAWSIDTLLAVRFHPRLYGDCRQTEVVFDSTQIPEYRELFARIVAKATPDALAVPGDIQCRYCRAKAVCPEFMAVSDTAIELLSEPPKDADGAVVLHNATLPANIIADRLLLRPKLKLIAKVMAEMEERAAALLAEGVDVIASDGTRFALEDGRNTRKFCNSVLAAKALKVAPEEAIAACGLSVAKLEQLHKTKTGLKGKAAKEDFEKRVGEFVEINQGKPRVAEVR